MMQQIGNSTINFDGYVEPQFEGFIEVFVDNFARSR